MSSSCYYPILKTTVSEMRALKQFDCSNSLLIMPIFELTKARKSKYDEIGDVYKRVQEIKGIVKGNSFYLDLTSESSLSNTQIESYFEDFNDFENWRMFIESLVNDGLHVRPIIQAYDDSTIEELYRQMEFFSDLCDSFAIRLKPEYLDMDIALNLIRAAQSFKYSTILDGEFVDDENLNYVASEFASFLAQCKRENLQLQTVVACSSSFPSMINHKNQDSGEFNLYERDFFYKLASNHPTLIIKYGDYASVHPFRNEVAAYNWVPRIDYPTGSTIVFCRKKREAGGYEDCAARMVEKEAYKKSPIFCWGGQEIIDACTKPNGRSPSYWISVRINIHLSRTVDWLN